MFMTCRPRPRERGGWGWLAATCAYNIRDGHKCAPDAKTPSSPVNLPLEPRSNASARMACITYLQASNGFNL
jgi:hypothetical protein